MTNSFGKFVKTTLINGFIFLVPVTVMVLLLVKAVVWVRKIIMPIVLRLPIENIARTGIPFFIAIVTIVVCCFLAGLIANRKLAKKGINWLEENFLSIIPGYSFIKSMGEGMVGVEDKTEVVLAWIEDSWQLAFVTDRLSNGLIAVFVPGAPSPWSGSLYFMTEEKIKKINLPSKEALAIIRRMGTGADKLMNDKIVIK